jgi:hypothetical protein
MFRVTFFCDDKKLGECLHGLAGLAQGTPEVVPVANAVAGKNGSVRSLTDRGKIVDMFGDWLQKTKVIEFRAQEARGFLKSIGMSPLSYSYMLTQAKDRGLIRKTGSGSVNAVWKVVPTRAKKARATKARAKKARPATAAASN